MDEYTARFVRKLEATAQSRGLQLQEPAIDGAVADAVLALARRVAHSSERKNAPIAAYLAGIAVVSLGLHNLAETAAFLNDVEG